MHAHLLPYIYMRRIHLFACIIHVDVCMRAGRQVDQLLRVVIFDGDDPLVMCVLNWCVCEFHAGVVSCFMSALMSSVFVQTF